MKDCVGGEKLTGQGYAPSLSEHNYVKTGKVGESVMQVDVSQTIDVP